MLGFNGGLMGVRRTPTALSGSGLWFQNEQSVAKRVDIWPGGNPIPALSPILWYDFADTATVTTSGTQVSTVTSKGSLNWTLSKSTTGPEYATAGINGLSCVDWGSVSHSNWLRYTATGPQAIGEIYFIVDGNYGGSFASRACLFSSTATASPWSIMGVSGTSLTNSNTSIDNVFVNGGATNRISDVFSTPSIDSPAIMRLVSSTSTTFNTNDGFQLGTQQSTSLRGWRGLMGECIVFSAPLSSTNRSILESWLAAKWGITLVA